MGFSVELDPRAIQDVQEIINFYEEQRVGLGEEFESELNENLITLELNPFYQIRYENVRCLPLNKFPYMIHYTLDEEKRLITIRAVFHTSRDPSVWKNRD